MVGKHTDRSCICGEAETVNHALLECSNWHAERAATQAELVQGGGADLSLKSILSTEDCERVKAVIQFLHLSGLDVRT